MKHPKESEMSYIDHLIINWKIAWGLWKSPPREFLHGLIHFFHGLLPFAWTLFPNWRDHGK
jgi:hypothetical protein